MSFTVQAVCDLARLPLNDSRKVRYPDATSMLPYFNSAIWRAYEIRPDLLFGTSWTPYVALAIGGTFPLPDRFAQSVADYIGGRCEMRDDDSANAVRAQALMAMFVAELSA